MEYVIERAVQTPLGVRLIERAQLVAVSAQREVEEIEWTPFELRMNRETLRLYEMAAGVSRPGGGLVLPMVTPRPLEGLAVVIDDDLAPGVLRFRGRYERTVEAKLRAAGLGGV